MRYEVKVLRPFEVGGHVHQKDETVLIDSLPLMHDLVNAGKAVLVGEVEGQPEPQKPAAWGDTTITVVRPFEVFSQRQDKGTTLTVPAALAAELVALGKAVYGEVADAETETATDPGPAETADAVARRRPSRAEAPAPAAPDTPDSPEQAG